MTRAPLLALAPLGALLFLATGCPAPQPKTEAMAPGAGLTATAQAKADAGKASARATEEAGRAEAQDAIGQAERDLAAAEEAKARFLAYSFWKPAVTALESARGEMSKPAFAKAIEHAREASAKAKLALSIANAAKAKATYRIRKGQTLWGISKSKLQDPFLWPLTHRANTEVISDPHAIEAGWKIVLPIGHGAEDADAARQDAYAAPTSADLRRSRR